MQQLVLTQDNFFASGGERDVYIHPQDSSKLIKIEHKDKKTRDQNELEFLYYNHLKKLNTPQTHIASCYGFVKTTLGKGLVFERVLNYDGSNSKPFNILIKDGFFSKDEELRLIEELKEYIFSNRILFVDVGFFNILCCEYEKGKFKLIIIDGLGGRRVELKFYMYLNFPLFATYKIKKQWNKTINEYKNLASIRDNQAYSWDSYSDQPHILKDRAYKKRIRSLNVRDNVKMAIASLFVLPLATLLMKFFRGDTSGDMKDFVGVGVNLDKDMPQGIQQELIEELGVEHLLVRVFLNDIQNIDRYVEFAKSFTLKSPKKIVISLIQNIKNLDEGDELREKLEIIFNKFDGISSEFQVANAINRLKWGFAFVEDFMEYYMVAQNLRDEKYPHIKLLGPSVIDFEYHYNVRAMFNLKKIRYDITSSLLYVDRRGSPQNRQYGLFDLKNKIDLLFALVKLSPKTTTEDIYITEVNWPIKDTAPYAPTSQKECVSNEEYTKYMLDYIKIAKDSRKIKRLYWHQLIAAGYGLVDNRDGKIVRYPQFYALKEFLKTTKRVAHPSLVES